MKFENKLNKTDLEEALINWVFGSDNQDGATSVVLDNIPWTDEMESVIPWRCVDEEIDEAIGLRGGWDVYRLLKSTPTIEDCKYRNEFEEFILGKVKKIDMVYENLINQLNKKIHPKKMFKVYTKYCLEVEAETHEEAERKADENHSHLYGLGDDWCWCEDFDAVLVESP